VAHRDDAHQHRVMSQETHQAQAPGIERDYVVLALGRVQTRVMFTQVTELQSHPTGRDSREAV
jgi:hypothetical protein